MNRRSLLSTAVWSVPVVAVAVAAPRAAASCRAKPSSYDPRLFSDHRSTQNNVATMRITEDGNFVVEFVRDYPNATEINIDGKRFLKSNTGRKAGEVLTVPLSGCRDPKGIQVDGNNIHYKGNGVFG